jgi:arginine N-succinyltransferase
MVKLRPLLPQDHQRIISYAFAGSEGLTSMPKDRLILERKLAFVQQCFKKESFSEKEKGLFLFVLENDKGLGVGFSGIKTRVGAGNWALSFTDEQHSLQWTELPQDASELCSLYLDMHERQHLWGKALSYCRFFFITRHMEFFQKKLLAELRGWVLPTGECPFWNEIKLFSGSKQSKLFDFKTAHHLVATERAHVRELLPEKLPRLDQFSSHLHPFIGHAHEHTAAAERLLQEIAFEKQNRLDALDGGPHYEKNLLSCPIMACIHQWNLAPKEYPSDLKTLVLIDTSSSKAPQDFELQLVCAFVDEKSCSLFITSDLFEKIGRYSVRALALEAPSFTLQDSHSSSRHL